MNAERDAADAKREVIDLKQSLPNSKDLQAAALSGDAIKQQRKAAKQLIARADVTLAELNGIDSGVLTPMYQEQLRLTKQDTAWREMLPEQQQFQFQTPAAQARFEAWRNTVALDPQQGFQPYEPPQPQRAYDLWLERQNSAAGQYQRNFKQQQALDRDVMVQRADAKRSKPKAKPNSNVVQLGKMRPLN